MNARDKFLDAIDNGRRVHQLAFTGWLSDFTASDRAWLRRQVKSGSIVELMDWSYPAPTKAYARP